MNYTDLNRAGGIGSNCALIELGRFKFLVDAGLHPKGVGLEAMPELDLLKGVDLDFIILTHCHLDHLGALPVVVRMYPGIPVFMTQPSQILAPRMLRNSVNVMKRQREEQGIAEYPLYTFAEVERLRTNIRPLRFEQPEVIRKKGDQLTLTFYPSGHVAGAASLLIEHQGRTIYHTGDILFDDLLTLPGARIPSLKADVVITETTRGLNERAAGKDREAEWERLYEAIDATLARGGTCLLPVFALGRLQEVLAMLYDGRKRGKLRRAPVYAAGLGMDIVEIFDQISRETGLVKFRKRLIRDLRVEQARYPTQPGFEKMPKGIYVLSSGMMVEKTPSYALASCLLHDANNSIFFVGYCDPDTPGGALKRCSKGDPFRFESYNLDSRVQAEVDSFDLSGHADREELMDLIAEFEPNHVVLTHGDPQARQWFAEQILKEQLVPNVIDPQPCVRCQIGGKATRPE
jgi:Cft2 family RNA processing exonuclease